MNQEVFSTVETITPEIAKEYLKFNKINRPLKQRIVSYYASMMRKGQWRLNGEGISFVKGGALGNGQHRLHAVIEAGIPIKFVVTRGCDEDSFNTYDSGTNRTSSDVFALNGIPNHTVVSSAAMRIFSIRRGTAFVTDDTGHSVRIKDKGRLSKEDILQEYKSSPILYDESVKHAKRCTKKLNIFTASDIAAFEVFLIKDRMHNHEYVYYFFDMLFGFSESTNKTIDTLREKLISYKLSGRLINTSLKSALLVKTWNSYVLGRHLSILRHEEDFSEIL